MPHLWQRALLAPEDLGPTNRDTSNLGQEHQEISILSSSFPAKTIVQCGNTSPSMAAVLAGLKSVDFYRKLKRDLQQELTEVRAVCLHALSGSRTFGVVCVCVSSLCVDIHDGAQASFTGAVLSGCAALFMIFLVIAEFRSVFTCGCILGVRVIWIMSAGEANLSLAPVLC